MDLGVWGFFHPGFRHRGPRCTPSKAVHCNHQGSKRLVRSSWTRDPVCSYTVVVLQGR